jgi:hypothetical protein
MVWKFVNCSAQTTSSQFGSTLHFEGAGIHNFDKRLTILVYIQQTAFVCALSEEYLE